MLKDYVISWKSKLTDATGEGTGRFSKQQADDICHGLNEEPNAVCIHTPKRVDGQE